MMITYISNNTGNDSASNPVVELANVSRCPNEDSVDEGAQTEALDAVRGYALVFNGNVTRSKSEADIGKFINCSSESDDSGRAISDTEHVDSMPRPCVSSCGRLLKPTPKLLQLPNTTDAPAGESTSWSERKQPKRHRLNAIIAREISSQHNRLQSGVANSNWLGIGVEGGVSEPSGSGSVVGLDGRANGVARQAIV